MLIAVLADVSVPASFFVIAIIAIAAQSILLIVALFDPGLRYDIDHSELQDMDRREFLHTLEAVTDAQLSRDTRLDVFTNGEQFYEAELDAIRRAERTINLEAYIFQKGRVGDRFLAALAERARAGVEIRVVLDGVGSAGATKSDFAPVIDAGGKLAFYHPLRFTKLPAYNRRTHRELLVVDGTVGFAGGAGIADHWFVSLPDRKRWRDTMVRLEGSVVNHLQATFAENWLEACGELLVGDRHFPDCPAAGRSEALVVNSTPSAGGASRARVLFQMLLASAKRSIHITTPYFLPDRSLSRELTRAVERGVEVKVLVPGRHADHMLTRSSSRLAYGRLLPHGIRIFEYRPTMLHAKILIIDSEWAVFGSTNFDNRSFGLNDEVNVAVRDEAFARRLEQDFVRDMGEALEVSYSRWKARSLFARGPELLGWLLERQQ